MMYRLLRMFKDHTIHLILVGDIIQIRKVLEHTGDLALPQGYQTCTQIRGKSTSELSMLDMPFEYAAMVLPV
ncbi:MAG: hypothetical protein ACLRZ6_06285 [Lachnospiraceae bacterium]